MRRTSPPTFLAFAGLACAALACGGDTDAGAAEEAAPGAESAPVAEDPGLPTDATEFRPTGGQPGPGGIDGRLWISTASTVEADGFTLLADLENLPTERAYSWALHRGGCEAPDQPVLPLGFGTTAGTDRGAEVANGGGPLGEMRLTFKPRPDGSASETVFVPVGGELSRQALEAHVHSVRLHPNVEGEDPGPSVACAPVPELPRPGEHDPEGPQPPRP